MRGLASAARYLTIVPIPGRHDDSTEALGRAAPWFPVVGAGMGVVLVAADRLTSTVFPPILAALLTITMWKLLAGGLHLDGLADCLDGLMGHDRAHRLAIMRDSRIGVFGALGLIIALLVAVTSVAELPARLRWRVLLVTPIVGRATPPLLALVFRPARPAGQGASFIGGVRAGGAGVAMIAALVISVVTLGVAGAVACLAGYALALATGQFLSHRLGGITGDVLGAAVELTELAVLLTLAAWGRGAW